MNNFKKIIHKFAPIIFILILIMSWEIIVNIKGIEKYIMPSPTDIFQMLVKDFHIMVPHILVTLYESFIGMVVAIILALVLAIVMDLVPLIKRAIYPILIISQTVPVVAIAPLLIIWFGFGVVPKIIVVVLVCFFPIVISISDGLSSVDKDLINHFKLMGGSKIKTFIHLKLPYGIINFFSGLKIAATYSVMGAVIGEWLGGDKGLGVYMTRARNTYALDKMFAAIIIIVVMSIAMFYIIQLIEKLSTPWNKGKL